MCVLDCLPASFSCPEWGLPWKQIITGFSLFWASLPHSPTDNSYNHLPHKPLALEYLFQSLHWGIQITITLSQVDPFFVCFWYRLSLYSLGWPQTHDPPDSGSWVLGLQMWSTMARYKWTQSFGDFLCLWYLDLEQYDTKTVSRGFSKGLFVTSFFMDSWSPFWHLSSLSQILYLLPPFCESPYICSIKSF
jgi:hypothetical protein